MMASKRQSGPRVGARLPLPSAPGRVGGVAHLPPYGYRVGLSAIQLRGVPRKGLGRPRGSRRLLRSRLSPSARVPRATHSWLRLQAVRARSLRGSAGPAIV